MKILVVYYSMYGHMYQMAQAAAEGAKSVKGAEVTIKRAPETLTKDVLSQMGAAEAQKAQSSVEVCTVEDLAAADGIIFGTPTRFGEMCGQMRQFMDSTGGLWMKGALVGKVGSVMASSNTQHGGQESTIISFHSTLLHQGMVIAGLPYTFQGQMGVAEITGGSPYGAATIAGTQGERQPSKNELEAAKYQGRYTARLAEKLAGFRID